MNLTRTLLNISAWVALALAVACGTGDGKPAPASAEKAETAEEKAPSDLDQPVEKLMAASCEHDIPQYTCDECRYEVGVVKAPEELFDPAKGGTLQTVSVGSRNLSAGKDMNGEVRLNEERALYMSPRAPGIVHSILVDLGAKVAKGQVLFEVESAEYRQAKADVTRARAALALAQATASRETELYERKICPQKDLLEAQAAMKAAAAEEGAAAGRLAGFGMAPAEIDRLGTQPADVRSGLMPVRAPFSGTVLERALSLGALVQPGDKALLLADTSKIWVLTTLYESELGAVLGAPAHAPVTAEVTVTAYPGRIFMGTVERVGGTLDEATRTSSARVVVGNPENLLRAGMFARVRLSSVAEPSLVLPEDAILEDEGRSFVFIHIKGSYYIRRPVKVGAASGGWAEVTEGVSAGDTVVAKGAFLLKSDVLRSKMGAGCAD